MIGALAGIAATIWALDALRLRARAKALSVLEPCAQPTLDEHRFIVREGVVLDEATQRAASAHARTHDLEVLDLVPSDLPAWRTLLLLQTLDPAKFRRDRLAKGQSVGAALLVHTSVLERLGFDGNVPTDAMGFAELAAKLKKYACQTTGFAIAPNLAAPRETFASRSEMVRWQFGDLVFPVALAQLGFVLSAPYFAPIAGTIALGALHLQALFATLGTALKPRDRLSHTFLRAPIDLLSMLPGLNPSAQTGAVDERRAAYVELLAHGTERFFEPRREDCPLCQSRSLAKEFSTGDIYQWKPGRFTLERCTDCGHVFQNPRLSLEGLDFYYRDFYDGLGDQRLERIFSSESQPYRARASMLQGTTVPASWLDVGAGHGHFCCVAREVWPEARFDGLDLSESIDDAAKRRWVDTGYRGLFPNLAKELKGKYDVVSMSHYLEHTRDPIAELEAAAEVVPSGGYLMIEVPDPDSRMGRLLGAYWLPWFQPQHQHLISARNLERLLKNAGFEPISWHHGEAHQCLDFTFLCFSLLGQIARPIDLPWLAPTPYPLRLWNRAVWWVGVPLLASSWLVDRLAAPFFRRERWSNTYRVLARRRESFSNSYSQEAAQ